MSGSSVSRHLTPPKIVDKRLSFHEAGHAVVAHLLGIKIEDIVMRADPPHVTIQLSPEGMVWEALLFYAIGNAIELKLDPVRGWMCTSDHDFWVMVEILEEGTISWSAPDLTEDDDKFDRACKNQTYINTFVYPALEQIEEQAARIIEIPEVWAQITAFAEVLLTVDKLSGPEATQILEASQ